MVIFDSYDNKIKIKFIKKLLNNLENDEDFCKLIQADGNMSIN